MDNKNLKEIFKADALIFVSLLVFGIFGFSEIGIIIASGALGFIMLRGNMISVVLSVILVFLADFSVALSFNFSDSLVICMCAFALNYAIRAKTGLLSATVLGVMGIFAAFIIMFSVAEIANIEGMRLSDVRAFFEQTEEIIDATVIQREFEKIYSVSELAKLKNLTSMIIAPVSFISMAAFISYFAICVLKNMLNKSKSDLADRIISFSHIKADKMCLLVWGASLILFVSTAMKNQVVGAASLCMFCILSVFYLVCGISLLWYFVKSRQGIKKILFALAMIFAILVMMPTVFMIGIIDSFADIRKLRRGEQQNG